MPTALFEERTSSVALPDLLYADLLENGELPETRVVYSGISWNRYLEIDRALGDDRSVPRLFYIDGELEIVTTSNAHERIQRVISYYLDEYFEREEIETSPRGHTTMRLKEAGAEPDDAWCIGFDKPLADIALEVALTSGGIPKLKVYQHLAIPEVWIYRKEALFFYRLRDDQSGYDSLSSSQFAPSLDLALLYRCLAIDNWKAARKAIRAGLGT